MKDRKPRRLPIVLSIAATAVATASALHYRRMLEETEELVIRLQESDPGTASITFPSELMDEVRNGATLMYWRDESGKQCFKTTTNSLTKND